MTLGDICNKARALTHTDSQSYTAANFIIDVNIWYQNMVSMVLESQDETDFDDYRQTKYPVATRLLVAGQRDYAFATTSWTLAGKEGSAGTASQALLPLKVKRCDIAYDGVNPYRATPLEDGEIMQGIGNDLVLDQNYIKQAPMYGIKNNSLLVFPMAIASDVAAGAYVRLEFERTVLAFTSSDYTTDPSDSTVIPGFDAPFHPLLAYGAAYEFANANNLPQLENLKNDLQIWEQRLRAAYGRKQLDRELAFKYAYDYEFGR